MIQYFLCFRHIGLLESKRKSEMLGTFSNTFFKMATDIIFSSILSRFGLQFAMLFGVKVGKMATKNHSKNIPAKKSCGRSREICQIPL